MFPLPEVRAGPLRRPLEDQLSPPPPPGEPQPVGRFPRVQV